MKDIWAGIAARRLLPLLFVVMFGLSFGLIGCQKAASVSLPVASQPSPVKLGGRLLEVAPPAAIQSLRQTLDVYQPQVAIVSPRPDEVLSATTVNVRFQVRDLPIFKDEALGLGPHLHVILDNQPYQSVYDLDQPLVFKDLEPGTHTLRVFAVRPWHESFKNDGAYAQVTFHVLTQTATNHPDPKLPVLTYSSPQGRYGAEPILLDFYLTNAPLHLVAAEDDLSNWRIRCTINGESFVLEDWQPVYLKGFKRGDNWVKLEFLNNRGELVLNAFNNPVRLIQYEPGGKDPLSRLMRGELSASAAQGIVTPTPTKPAMQPAAPQPAATPPPTAPPKLIAPPQPSPPPATADTAPPKSAAIQPAPVPMESPAPAAPTGEGVPNREVVPPAAAPVPSVPPTPMPKGDSDGPIPTAESPKPDDLQPALEEQPAARSSPALAPAPTAPTATPSPTPTPAPTLDQGPTASETVPSPSSATLPSTRPPEDTPTATPPVASQTATSPVTKVNQWLERLRDRRQSPALGGTPPPSAPIAAPVTPPAPTAEVTDATSGQSGREETGPIEAAPVLPAAPATVSSPPPSAGAAIAP
ncbi:hypothetical protein OOK60_08780 [Trichothermofontia sichuanensis B231]|uniref:hypothetical protein n=1 Tax=Trichothermofontia sichuanensis TaxID=3045816 RepID=UPI002246E715|nr:hypothetical protein [Trichothermofontia sichuanensis]UZQ56130.1 hypothetical protein OOK60_08780 [Trichothermofontia sichuanensis B231]